MSIVKLFFDTFDKVFSFPPDRLRITVVPTREQYEAAKAHFDRRLE